MIGSVFLVTSCLPLRCCLGTHMRWRLVGYHVQCWWPPVTQQAQLYRVPLSPPVQRLLSRWYCVKKTPPCGELLGWQRPAGSDEWTEIRSDGKIAPARWQLDMSVTAIRAAIVRGFLPAHYPSCVAPGRCPFFFFSWSAFSFSEFWRHSCGGCRFSAVLPVAVCPDDSRHSHRGTLHASAAFCGRPGSRRPSHGGRH